MHGGRRSEFSERLLAGQRASTHHAAAACLRGAQLRSLHDSRRHLPSLEQPARRAREQEFLCKSFATLSGPPGSRIGGHPSPPSWHLLRRLLSLHAHKLRLGSANSRRRQRASQRRARPGRRALVAMLASALSGVSTRSSEDNAAVHTVRRMQGARAGRSAHWAGTHATRPCPAPQAPSRAPAWP
jgi:hypothetical protein